ncbi:unnamed protein product [Rotaria socialis]|uniref:Uncharacterized protein n=1 Tax=Rotaria socialis TaxID=392032 RepID=A0A818JPV2_9BILA|nr:unnamed protein product [Rotaria socialis]CAF4498541.1 unnamed protein product [Rotaria socialis]
MSLSSQQSFQQELTNDTPTEQNSADQLYQSPKETHQTVYTTPTKTSTLNENQAHGEIPPLVNFLSCYVSLTRYQEDKGINNPVINTEKDLDIEPQQLQKEEGNKALSSHDVDSYLEHKNPMNTMIIIDRPWYTN